MALVTLAGAKLPGHLTPAKPLPRALAPGGWLGRELAQLSAHGTLWHGSNVLVESNVGGGCPTKQPAFVDAGWRGPCAKAERQARSFHGHGAVAEDCAARLEARPELLVLPGI